MACRCVRLIFFAVCRVGMLQLVQAVTQLADWLTTWASGQGSTPYSLLVCLLMRLSRNTQTSLGLGDIQNYHYPTVEEGDLDLWWSRSEYPIINENTT